MQLDTVKAELEAIIDENIIKYNEPMKNHISFKVGGPADILVIPNEIDQVINVVNICKRNGIPFFIIGNGTNLIVRDGGFRGVIIKLTALNNVSRDGDKVIAGAGTFLSSVAREALNGNLTGMEFAAGIPGTVGGAITMNAGAYGGEIKEIVDSATLCNMQGEVFTLNNEEMHFRYRGSVVHDGNYIVLEATFNLKSGVYEDIKARMEELNKKRCDKQPLNYPSAGSTFKRPEGHFAGKLIEDSALKGVCVGGAKVSEKHAGFVINYKHATANDVLGVIKKVQDTVMDKFGIRLETEVKVIGED